MSQPSSPQLLTQLLSFSAEPHSSQALLALAAWDDLSIAAIALGLAPALHKRTADVDLPPVARAKLAVTYAATQQRNAAIAAQLAELLAGCAASAVEVVVLKGAYLAFQVYPDPALRGMSDIDLLFQPGDLPQGEAVLQSLGYQGKHKPASEGPGIVKHTSTYKRALEIDPANCTPNPYLSTAGDRHVDPHGSLEESWFGLRVDVTPGVWQRSQPITLVGQPARALTPEDLLLHLGVHLIFHLLMGKPSLVQLYDLAVVCDRLPMDWQALLARSQERQATAFLYAALHLADEIFAAPLPPDALSALRQSCPARLANAIDDLGLADLMEQTQRPPLRTVRQRLVRGVQDRRDTARWATSWHDKWAVWRTALAVGRTDTGKLIAQRLRGTASSDDH